MIVLFATIVAMHFKPHAVAVSRFQAETPEYLAKRSAANNKFRKWFSTARTLSVDITINQVGNPVPGKATLVLERPDKLFYNLKWAKDDYTYTIDNGVATEVDLGQKSYEVYDVPGWSPPEANGSDWVTSFFPNYFVDDKILLPPDCFDSEGRVSHYAIGSGTDTGFHKNTVTFANYKINMPVPESRFKQTIPAGLSVYGTPRPAPPIQIGEVLPNVSVVSATGRKTTLMQALSGKQTLVACVDPDCAPSMASLSLLKKLNKPSVLVLNLNPKNGVKLASLPVFHSSSGNLMDAMRAPMTPLYYFVNGSGKVLNVWYGFDRDQPSKFADQIKEAVKAAHS